jgi:hypothetical protein
MSQRLADPDQTRNRLEILNQFFREMLLLNGGGCVALLAFLQAIWKDAGPGFVRGIVVGISFFILGLALTVAGSIYVTKSPKRYNSGEVWADECRKRISGS